MQGIFAAVTGNADAHGKNHSFLYAQDTRRMAPLYDPVCTLAWPQLSTTLSMKIGSAATLAEISPEHFKQLCGMAKLGWPMTRERIKTMCRQILDATGEPQVLPELKDATVRKIVTRRRAVARKPGMAHGDWQFEKKLDIRPCFGSFSLPWKH